MDDLDLAVIRSLDSATVREIVELVDRTTDATGHESLSEQKRIDLVHGPNQDDVDDDARLVLAVVVRRGSPSHVVGYGHLNERSQTFAMQIVVDGALDDPSAVTDRIFEALIDQVATRGGGTVRLWVPKATEVDDRRAFGRGFHRERNLIQMRCPLPLPPPAGGLRPSPTMTTRPFRPGLDEDAWLTTNNRAFASHPEQGHWKRSALLVLEQEPWFDPEGFLLLEEDGRVAGSCWTKVHPSTDPPMGEIYVIGVDPDFHGRGWGRLLTHAGLDWLAGRGLTVGMLYVDEDNLPATTMYRSMGFVDDHVDRAYVGVIAPR